MLAPRTTDIGCEMSDKPPIEHPPGEYAIVELFGHQTLVGRIAEVERFGGKMLAIEPLYDGTMLPVVYQGGAAIYRLTPCSAEVAHMKQPRAAYQLPTAIRATLPATLLEYKTSGTETVLAFHEIEPDDSPDNDGWDAMDATGRRDGQP